MARKMTMGDCRTSEGDRIVWRTNSRMPDWLEFCNGKYFGPEYKPVLTKHDFVKRYSAGEFGNRSPTWDTLEDYLSSGNTSDLIHIRNRIAGGATWYNVPACRVERTYHEALATGLNPSQLYFSAMCPTEKTLIQGEVIEIPGGLFLFYSTVRKPMRESLKEGGRMAHSSAGAKLILKHYLNPRSYEWLEHLLENYPGHVVEFTCLSTCWGTDAGFNTLFWEVRNY